MGNVQNNGTNNNGRRSFLKGTVPVMATAFIPGISLQSNADKGSEPSFPGLIIREKEPVNFEFPFPMLSKAITANNQFFIRTHFPIPKLQAKEWKMTIGGHVNKEITLTYDELRALPAKKVMATLECAGNGRANLAPKVKGLLWEQGAVGNAEWTGVPLSVLLEKAGIKEGAVEIILEGADKGEVSEEPKSPGAIHFARSLPLNKAMQAEVLIAYQMNGKDLSPEHGFPVRAIIPGWYGMASVKWLTKIVAVDKPFEGYWQTLEYAYWKHTDDQPTLTAVTEVQVKAEIARPALSEVIPGGKKYRVHGAAWCGESDIVKVELSFDEGKTWKPAKLLGKNVKFAWRLWEYDWQVPKGQQRHKLMSRATDSNGNTQPMQHDKDRRTYMVNKIVTVEVESQ